MSHTPRRGRAAVAGFATFGVLVFAAPAAGAPFTNACKNSATNNNVQIDVTQMDGTAPATVDPGAKFDVTNINGVIRVPKSIFETGYNLGLVRDGDNATGTIQMVIEGTGTTEGTQTTPEIPYTVKVKINDPTPDQPNSGDETSEDAVVPFTVPNQTWTASTTPSQMEFRVKSQTPISPVKGGVLVSATLPPPPGGTNGITVKFGCNPGTVTGDAPGIPKYQDVGASYASSTIVGAPPVVYEIPNTFRFGKVVINRKRGFAVLPVFVPGPGVVRAKVGKKTIQVERPTSAGRVDFLIVPTRKALRKLRRKGKLKVRLTVSFTPTGGNKLTKRKTITLRRKK